MTSLRSIFNKVRHPDPTKASSYGLTTGAMGAGAMTTLALLAGAPISLPVLSLIAIYTVALGTIGAIGGPAFYASLSDKKNDNGPKA